MLGFAALTPFKPGDWTCPRAECRNHNFASRVTCKKCGEQKPVPQVQQVQQVPQTQQSPPPPPPYDADPVHPNPAYKMHQKILEEDLKQDEDVDPIQFVQNLMPFGEFLEVLQVERINRDTKQRLARAFIKCLNASKLAIQSAQDAKRARHQK